MSSCDLIKIFIVIYQESRIFVIMHSTTTFCLVALGTLKRQYIQKKSKKAVCTKDNKYKNRLIIKIVFANVQVQQDIYLL